ncbi:MAG: transglutaminase-like domain-containing protein [Pseudomonadota bacterium]
MPIISVDVDTSEPAHRLLIAPIGMPSPHQTLVHMATDDVPMHFTQEAQTGQSVIVLPPIGLGARSSVTFRYQLADGGTAYPEAMFLPRASRFTRAADALIDNAREVVAGTSNARETIDALVAHTAQAFTYGHPDARFYEGLDEVPMLGCGITAGSCVDINIYLIAALRSVGIEAGYAIGYFFPEEKNGTCNDMHCWVVTRADGEVLEWDIAHHLKLGTRDIRPGLNPKPGERYAISHSMGWDIPALGVRDSKLLCEPMWVEPDGSLSYAELSIRLQRDRAQAA